MYFYYFIYCCCCYYYCCCCNIIIVVISSILFVYPVSFSFDFVFFTSTSFDVDENGMQHILLCRVIMGNMEVIHPESKQFHPSNENYDSGVDDLQNPKHYVIWDTDMNTRIYPEYVVSFKVSSKVKGNSYSAPVLIFPLPLPL